MANFEHDVQIRGSLWGSLKITRFVEKCAAGESDVVNQFSTWSFKLTLNGSDYRVTLTNDFNAVNHRDLSSKLESKRTTI